MKTPHSFTATLTFVAHVSSSVAMYCKESVHADVPNLRGDGLVATLHIEGVQYECDENNDTCWAVDAALSPLTARLDAHYIRTSMDALVLTKSLCQTESAVPRNCAAIMRGIDRHCNVLPRKPERALRCSASLIEQQRSQWATLTAGRLKAYLPPSGALYQEYANMAVFLVNIQRVLLLLYPLHNLPNGRVVVVDAGAHQGQFSELVHTLWNSDTFRISHAKAHIVAFEPIAYNRKVFSQWIEAKGFAERTNVQPFALGIADGESEIFVSGGRDGLADEK